MSNATGTFLGGSLLDLVDLDAIANIEGAAASNDGTIEPDVTEANNLDLTALSALTVAIPGGIQLPLSGFASAGVVGQYASALPDGSSVGASGLVGEGGAIGTGVDPLPGVAPGPLTLSLDNVVSSLAGTVAADLVDELASLDLTLGAVSASASQAAPDAPVGDYDIASGVLTIESETVAALAGELNAAVGALQDDVDGLSGALTEAVDDLLSVLSALVSADVDVETMSLTDAISSLLTEPLTDPAYPGVSIDLSTGTITVDLDELHPLNGQAPNTEILTGETIQAIEDGVFGLIDGLLDEVVDTLTTGIRGLEVTGGASLFGVDILTVDTTVGALLDGDTSGIALLGIGLTLPGGLAAVVAALVAPLNDLIDSVNAIATTLIEPVNSLLLPALDQVLPLVVSLTVNNQSTSPEGVFSETAAIITVLPTLQALTLELANATVGPNSIEITDVEITDPTEGEEIVAPDPAGTVDVPVSGTGEPGATVEVTIPGQDPQSTVVDEEGNWTVTFPGLPIGDYTATATQTGGSTDSVNFSVVEDITAVDITSPSEGEEFTVPTDADVTDVIVSGDGEPGANIEVVVDGQTETTTVGVDGTWTVTFEDLPVGDYTAVATQDEDGSTDSVSFIVATEGAVDTDATDADADATDADADATDADATDADADATDADADTDATDADATDADATDADATDADATDADATDADATDADATDADADATDADATDADTDATDADATDADADVTDADADATDADATDADTDATDADATDADADATDADATDADATDADSDTDATDADATDADATDADADATDADADTDATDADATDADAADADVDTDATDADATDADADTDATDADADTDATDADADTDATDADATDADATDADATDADATDADADATDADADTDATDADATDADATDADATDADADTDADATDADATDADADADATDADATDADVDTDATDADATDADATDADATDADADADATDADADTDATDADADADADGGPTALPVASVTQTRIVRGTGVVQVVNGSGFEPGETVSATVMSTPFDLVPVVADAAGTVQFTFPIDATFELGDHRVEVRGSVSGELPVEREHTAFTVVTPALAATGVDPGGLLVGGAGAVALLAAGAGLMLIRRKQTA